jgi:uncharacterized protein HemX
MIPEILFCCSSARNRSCVTGDDRLCCVWCDTLTEQKKIEMNEHNSRGSNFTAVLMLVAVLLLLGGGGVTFYLYRVHQIEQMEQEMERAELMQDQAVRARREAELKQQELEPAADANSTDQ